MPATKLASSVRRGGIALILTVLASVLLLTTGAQAAPVASGTLDWGIKTSFRTYITGSIANGDVIVGGGAQSTGGAFRFPVTGGDYDPASGSGTISFGGSVTFRGHDYGNGALLDMTVSNLRLEVSGSTGTLRADLRSRPLIDLDPAAEPPAYQNQSGVALASVALGPAGGSGTSVSWSGAAATLTGAGAPAFGDFYQAGDALDPVTVALTLGTGTSTPPPSGGSGAPPPAPPSTGTGLTQGSDYSLEVGVVLAAMAAAATGVAVIRKAR